MESGVKCRLHLRRKPRHYVMNNTLPAVPLGIFNLLVFVIPTDAREKNVSCDDRVSVSWCLFVELKYSTSHWLLQNIPARGLWRIWNDFGIVIIVISRSSFQLKLHHRKSEQKRRSQSFSEVSSSLRGFYEMVLVQNALWQVSAGIREKSETKIFKEDRDVVDISDDADDVIGLNYRLLIRFNHPRTYLFTS